MEFIQSQEEFPKKSLKILSKILKDNVKGYQGDVKALKMYNETLKKCIFQFKPLTRFLKLAGYEPKVDKWIVNFS